MKLKCNDGFTRNFSIARVDGEQMPDGSRHGGFTEASCEECGVTFGCHDTSILKPRFKNHVCKRMNKRRKKNA